MAQRSVTWRVLTLAAIMMMLLAAGHAWAQDDAGEAPAAEQPAAEQTDDGGQDGTASGLSLAEMFFMSKDPATGSLNLLGSAIIWFLLLMSVATVALLIHFLLQNRRSTVVPDDLIGDLEGLLGERKFKDAIALAEEDESTFGEVMHAALTEASNGYGAMERAVEETADLSSTRKLRQLELLNVFGAVGPMIGLFGTVYGMIVAFWTIVEAGGQPKPADLAAGISTALVTTFWGLIVGIPAVASAALIRTKIESLVTEAMVEAEALIGRFRPGGAKKSATQAASGAGSSSASPKPKAE